LLVQEMRRHKAKGARRRAQGMLLSRYIRLYLCIFLALCLSLCGIH